MKCRLQPQWARLHEQHPPPHAQFQRSPRAPVQGTDWLRMGGQSSAGSSSQLPPPPSQLLRQVHEAPPSPLRAPPPPRALPGSAYKGGLHRTA
jgi:hypothetical protein